MAFVTQKMLQWKFVKNSYKSNFCLLTWWFDSRFLLQQFDMGNRWIWIVLSLQICGILISLKMLQNKANHNWKWGLLRPKFLYENLSPHPLYHNHKKPKKNFLLRKSQWRSWNSWGSSLIGFFLGFSVTAPFLKILRDGVLIKILFDRFLIMFLINRFLFSFLSRRFIFRVLSDRVFFESSVTGSSLGSSVIDSSLGSSVLFLKRATTFSVKKKCSVLHYIFKKNFTLNNQFNPFYNDFNITDSQNYEEILAWWKHRILFRKYISLILQFTDNLHCWIYGSYCIKNCIKWFRNQTGVLFHFQT